jgi:hypothetical protein
MVKKILKIMALLVTAAFVAIQFFGIDKSRPLTGTSETLEAAVELPADIALILGRSCNDCHSHNTVYPWYANVQPFGWFLKDHIEHGSEHLNFSIFNTYSTNKKAKKLEEICEAVRSGEMPLPSYLWIHRDAVLSNSEREALCEWAETQGKKLRG